MCGNHYGKKLSLCFLVLLLACSCAWAFPGRAKASGPEPEAIQEESLKVPEMPEVILPVVTTITSEPTSKQSENLPTSSEATTTVLQIDGAQLADLIDQRLDNILTGVNDAEGYTNDIEAEKAELAAANAAQADEIARKDALLKKEQGTKFFAKITGVLGFEDSLPVFGAGGSVGIRFGKGLLLEFGSTYKIGNLVTVPVLDLSLDRFSFNTSIGWEW